MVKILQWHYSDNVSRALIVLRFLVVKAELSAISPRESGGQRAAIFARVYRMLRSSVLRQLFTDTKSQFFRPSDSPTMHTLGNRYLTLVPMLQNLLPNRGTRESMSAGWRQCLVTRFCSSRRWRTVVLHIENNFLHTAILSSVNCYASRVGRLFCQLDLSM